MRTVPLSVLRPPARFLACLACAAAVASCGGTPKKVHTDAPAWEPPDTFDDLPRTTASRPSSPDDSPAPAPAADAPSAPEPARSVSVGHRVVPVGAKIDVSSRMAIQALFSVETPNGTATVAATDVDGGSGDSLVLSFSHPSASAGCSPGEYPKPAPNAARRNLDIADTMYHDRRSERTRLDAMRRALLRCGVVQTSANFAKKAHSLSRSGFICARRT